MLFELYRRLRSGRRQDAGRPTGDRHRALDAAIGGQADDFLAEEHFRSEPEHYARNAIHMRQRQPLALRAGLAARQWTPVHDHGCWGVVGLVRGVLEERSYMSASGDIASNSAFA